MITTKRGLPSKSIFASLVLLLCVSIPVYASQEGVLAGLKALPGIWQVASTVNSVVQAGTGALTGANPHAPASKRSVLASVSRHLEGNNSAVRWAKLGVFVGERTENLALYVTEFNAFKERILKAFDEGELLNANHDVDGNQITMLGNRLADIVKCRQEALEVFNNYRANVQVPTAQQAAYFLQASQELCRIHSELLPAESRLAQAFKKERKAVRPALTNFFAHQSQSGLTAMVNKGFFNYTVLYDSDNEEGEPVTDDETRVRDYMHRVERSSVNFGREPSGLKRLRADSGPSPLQRRTRGDDVLSGNLMGGDNDVLENRQMSGADEDNKEDGEREDQASI